MSAFNTINGVPASANAFTLRHVLRGEWGYKGLVVSDWTSITELMEHGIANDGRMAAKKAALAGVDMDMEGNLYESHLAALVRSGEVPVKLVDESVRNVLRVKFLLGLFEHPYVPKGEDVMSGTIPQASRDAARKVAEESFVLLKNDAASGKPMLPLQVPSGTTVAVIGPMADSRASMLGAWVGMGRPEDVVTLRKSLEDYATPRGLKLLFAEGTPILGGNGDFAAALHAAQASDIVLLTVGEEAATMTGEAASRTRLELPGMQEQLIAKVAALGKPTAVIVFFGTPAGSQQRGPAGQCRVGSLVPGRGSRPSAGAHSIRRKQPERTAYRDVSAQRWPGTALLQCIEHRTPRRRSRSLSSPVNP